MYYYVNKQLVLLRKDTIHARNNTDIIRDELGKKCFTVVISTGNKNDDNILIIIKKNIIIVGDDSSEDIIIFEYTIIRSMKLSRNATIEKYRRMYPDMEIVLEIKYVPNAIILWKNIRNELNSGRKPKLDVSRNDFNLCGRYTQQKLVDDIKRIYDYRLKFNDVDD